MEERIEETKELANQTKNLYSLVNNSMDHIKDSIEKMDRMMEEFISVVNDQNKKIDEFINSDKRMNNKKEMYISVLQVISGIIIAVLGMWGYGQM